MLREAELHAVEMRVRALSDVFHATVSDLLLLAELNDTQIFIAEDTPPHREDLTREALAFLHEREAYDAVRVVDSAGRDVVNVQRDEAGRPAVVAPDSSGSEGVDTPVVPASFGGGVYLAPFRLASVDGAIESPPKPVLAVGIELLQDGRSAGAVIVDVLATSFLRSFDQAHPEAESRSMLVSGDGYWIRGTDSSEEWGNLLTDRRGLAFATAFPREWQRISSDYVGQFETPEGLFTYSTIRPLDEIRSAVMSASPVAGDASPVGSAADPDAWRVVSYVPSAGLARTRYVGLSELVVSDALGVLLLAAGFWVMVRRSTHARLFRTRVVAENALLSSTLGRYLPKVVAARLRGDSSRLARLGGESRFVAVLFADIRGFTRFAETRSPHDVVASLNLALSAITAPVTRYHGVLDKYVGDGLLAFFEATSDPEGAARNAINAARDMQTAFAQLLRDAEGDSLGELGLGVGINAGRVIVGNIGSEDVMDYTVIGDPVNVAARLQAAAESGEILLTGEVRELMVDELSRRIHASSHRQGEAAVRQRLPVGRNGTGHLRHARRAQSSPAESAAGRRKCVRFATGATAAVPPRRARRRGR